MNKTLSLVRHAQSPFGAGLSDIDRQLSDAGLDDAKALGTYMCSKNYHPDLVLCSSAERTKQTFQKICSADDALEVEYAKAIYSAGKRDLLNFINETDDRIEHLMIIGHNPAIYEIAASLIGDGAERLLHKLTQGFMPATLCVIETDIESWKDVAPGKNRIIDLVNPMDYNSSDRPTRWM
ncbi:MAG: histidine phosphatase family protein [Micavibrio sp.]|nr:histidine phosphatase family protein [Micavibrio sp.]